MRVGFSVSGRRTRRSPSSRTSGSTRSSTVGRVGQVRSAKARIVVFKDMGLVSQVFNEATLDSLGNAHLAIGHCRYSTTGASVWKNAQPTFRSTAIGSIALGHNGNLTNSLELQSWLTERDKHSGSLLPGSLSNDATSDTS